MRVGYIPYFVLLLCCLNATSFGQKVTIRVVTLNGKPFTNKQVYVSGLSSQATSRPDELLKLTKKPIRADLSLMTDSKGETMFELPNPVPANVYVRPVFSKRVWDCSCFVAIATDKLLQKGIVTGSPTRKKPKPSIQPIAGELVFVMSRTPWWWWLVYDVEKG